MCKTRQHLNCCFHLENGRKVAFLSLKILHRDEHPKVDESVYSEFLAKAIYQARVSDSPLTMLLELKNNWESKSKKQRNKQTKTLPWTLDFLNVSIPQVSLKQLPYARHCAGFLEGPSGQSGILYIIPHANQYEALSLFIAQLPVFKELPREFLWAKLLRDQLRVVGGRLITKLNSDELTRLKIILTLKGVVKSKSMFRAYYRFSTDPGYGTWT